MPFFSGRPISTIDRSAVRRFIAEMQQRGYAAKTIRATVVVLKQILDLPLEDKVIFENPAVRHKLGSSREREPIFLTSEQLALLAAEAGFPWSVVVEFIGATGLRPAETAGLRIRRLDMLRGKVEIRETLTLVNGRLIPGPTKTHETRVISVPRSVIECLPAYLKWRCARLGRPLELEDYVFGGPMGSPLSSNRLQRSVVRPAASRLGLPEGFRTYDLRHTHASILIANAAHPRAIMERLGHKDIKTTMNVYGHLFPELDEELTDRLDETLRSAGERVQRLEVRWLRGSGA